MMGRHGKGVFDLLGLMWFKSPEEKAMPTKQNIQGSTPIIIPPFHFMLIDQDNKHDQSEMEEQIFIQLSQPPIIICRTYCHGVWPAEVESHLRGKAH
jgi:hypothetical protein